MSEYKSKKARTEHNEHSENCGCESITGVTEERHPHVSQSWPSKELQTSASCPHFELMSEFLH
jgi:hypothetical protein